MSEVTGKDFKVVVLTILSEKYIYICSQRNGKNQKKEPKEKFLKPKKLNI